MGSECAVAGCGRATTGELCEGHRKRKRSGRRDWDAELRVYRPKSETQNLDARISKQLAERLEALARRRGVARAALVRELLEEAVEET